ncbi:MAG: type II toxin-antitoxin system PemK/MazF family toxin [Candidatus Geothermincolia bacterium]
MKRGEVYRVVNPSVRDPRKSRVFVVVSRQVVLESRFSTVVCAPVYSRHDGLSTQVSIGINEGLKHESSIHCDELISLPKSMLTNYLGTLSPAKIAILNKSLVVALELEDSVGAAKIR